MMIAILVKSKIFRRKPFICLVMTFYHIMSPFETSPDRIRLGLYIIQRALYNPADAHLYKHTAHCALCFGPSRKAPRAINRLHGSGARYLFNLRDW